MAKGKNEKAEVALCWLRGWVPPEMVKHEFLELVHYNEISGRRRTKTDTVNGENDESFRSKLAQFKDPAVYKPLKLMTILFFVSYISSIFHTRPFITKIMTKVDIIDHQNESLVRIQRTPSQERQPLTLPSSSGRGRSVSSFYRFVDFVALSLRVFFFLNFDSKSRVLNINLDI